MINVGNRFSYVTERTWKSADGSRQKERSTSLIVITKISGDRASFDVITSTSVNAPPNGSRTIGAGGFTVGYAFELLRSKSAPYLRSMS